MEPPLAGDGGRHGLHLPDESGPSGVGRARTSDIRIFSAALSQLSYDPLGKPPTREWYMNTTGSTRRWAMVQALDIGPRHVADGPTPLRDYYRDDGVHVPVVLADYVGSARHGPVRRTAEALVRANNRVSASIGDVPRQWERDVDKLRDPLERRLLFRAFIDDTLLTEDRRKSMVSLLIWSFILLWALAGIFVAIAARPALPSFQAIYELFFYGVATSLFLPLPFETLLNPARASLGVGWTVLVAALSKVAGAWLVLLMGDRAHAGVDQIIQRFPKLRRAWAASLALAQRYGYAAVFVLFAFPFMSDTAPLFLLAVMHMRKSIFLAVTFVAIAVRCLLFFFVVDLI